MTVEILKYLLPILSIILAWLLNRHSERKNEAFRKKEERYTELLLSLRGFYQKEAPIELLQKFFDQFYLCWLYCPDEVIRAGIHFIESAADGNTASDDDRQLALGNFVLALRTDLFSRSVVKKTSLEPKEFHVLNTSKQKT